MTRATHALRHPDSDLWILLATSTAAAVAGGLGVLGVEVTLAAVLGAIAVLCWSQIKTRHLFASEGVLLDQFPDAYYEARKSLSTSFIFIGNTMDRTLSTGRGDLERLLRSGGRVRVVLPDPSDDVLIAMIAKSHRYTLTADELSQRIRTALTTVSGLAQGPAGRVEVRTTSVLPRVGVNGLDVETARGGLMVQHFEYRAVAEPGPILWLTRKSQGVWYSRFCEEIERIWGDATPWKP